MNFRGAMLILRGNITVFVRHQISALFVGLCVLLIAAQIYVRLHKPKALTTEIQLNTT
jgi:putative tricarboxylic transport membrane protein